MELINVAFDMLLCAFLSDNDSVLLGHLAGQTFFFDGNNSVFCRQIIALWITSTIPIKIPCRENYETDRGREREINKQKWNTAASECRELPRNNVRHVQLDVKQVASMFLFHGPQQLFCSFRFVVTFWKVVIWSSRIACRQRNWRFYRKVTMHQTRF